MTWQSEVTPEEWKQLIKIAEDLSRSHRIKTSLGYEDYAATALKKLWSAKNRPENIEAWLALTITRQFIDRHRRIRARGGQEIHDLDDAEWDRRMFTQAMGSPSAILRLHESVEEVLAVLNDKEKEILIMDAAGYKTAEIAEQLGFGSGRIVATRLSQIKKKIRTRAVGESGRSS